MGQVVSVLYNGVGNQLFQYAAGRTVAAATERELRLAPGRPGDDQLFGLLPHLSADRTVLDPPEPVGRTRPRTHQRARRAWMHRRGRIGIVRQSTADSFAAMPAIEHLEQGAETRLVGQFQHPTWWQPALDDVAVELAHAVTSHPAYERGAAVVSFRRRDYVINGWALPLDYYRAAFARLGDHDDVVIVTDDTDFGAAAAAWCRELGLPASLPETEPETRPESDVDAVVRDLALLAGASAVVMSNSTFCWWGTVVGDRIAALDGRHRQVIAPSTWIPVTGSRELLHPDWERIG